MQSENVRGTRNNTMEVEFVSEDRIVWCRIAQGNFTDDAQYHPHLFSSVHNRVGL